MENQGMPEWGVVGLTEAEQRQVRGGASSRASCVRNAVRNYISNVRSSPSNRRYYRSRLLNSLRNCC